jgi:hypothetical protein
MTFGLRLTNPRGTVVLDEKNPLYVIPPIRVVGWRCYLQAERIRSNKQRENTYVDRDWELAQEFELRFSFPLISQMPPLAFVDQKYAAEGYFVDFYPGKYQASVPRIFRVNTVLPEGWLSHLRVVPLGVAGRWTGVKVTLMSIEHFRTQHQSVKEGEQEAIMAAQLRDAMIAQAPNLAKHFIAVGYGVEPRPGAYGLVVRSATGEVVFNSDSNTAVALDCSSRWSYLDRIGGDGEYFERWQLVKAAPSADAYCRVIQNQTYRRYNGETARVCMSSAKGTPMRIIVGGRSGSPCHTPMIWIKPAKPVEYW